MPWLPSPSLARWVRPQVRKKQDLYLWVAKSPDGPSVKFLVANVHTMAEVGGGEGGGGRRGGAEQGLQLKKCMG